MRIAPLLPVGMMASASVFAASDAAPSRPNILFIMSDDHAANAISCFGSRINRTPNIDRLAAEGAKMERVYATNPICAPSRACILTGMYSHKNGVPTFNEISTDIKTIGGYMRDAGYYTSFLGKWHMGRPSSVRDSDWDTWAVYENQGVYFDPFFFVRGPNGGVERKAYKGEYVTDNITRLAKEEIGRALESGKPFFMMMHHKAPHRNWIPSPKYRDKFRKLTLKDIPIPETLFDDYAGRASPIRTAAMTLLRHMRPKLDLKIAEYLTNGGEFEFEGKKYEGAKDESGKYIDAWPVGTDDRARTAFSYLRYMQDYLATVQSVDDSVGEMLDFLKEKGVDKNTLVIYTSDQGFFLGEHGLYDKRFIMEETLQMPFVARMPSAIAPGTVCKGLVSNVDFAPTFLDLAGVKAPDGMQGESFFGELTGKKPVSPDRAIYCRYYVEGGEHATAAWYGVVTATEKLVNYYKRGEWEYFDTAKDPEELHNRYADPAAAGRVEALKKVLAERKAALGDDDAYSDVGEYTLHPQKTK